MPGRRVERLNEQFRRELTELLRGAVKDPRVGLVTLTGVRVASDLSFARVFVAPPVEESTSDETLAGLRAATPFLRHELSARLHIRRVPELRFELDTTLANARRIEQLLHEVAASGGDENTEEVGDPKPGDLGSAGDPGPDD